MNNRNKLNGLFFLYWKIRYRKLGLKLGFSIEPNVVGYGLTIPHYGTIVVGAPNTVGNYAVLQSCAVITGNDKKIGDGLYMGTGAKITNRVVLGDNISVGANSVVMKDVESSNVLLVGAPANIKREDIQPWFERDGEFYSNKVKLIERLRTSFINER